MPAKSGDGLKVLPPHLLADDCILYTLQCSALTALSFIMIVWRGKCMHVASQAVSSEASAGLFSSLH
jgi:hypothetical protein